MEEIKISVEPAPPSFLVVHPSGNTYVRHDLRALREAEMLWRYLTGVGFGYDGWISCLPVPPPLRGEWARRGYDLPADLIRNRPLREMLRLLAPRLGASWLTTHETGWAGVDAVFHDLDAAAAKWIAQLRQTPAGTGTPNAVLAYEDGAEYSLAAARSAGWLGVYHLPIAYGPYARKIFQDEAERLPEWAPTLQGDRDSAEKIARKVHEAELADVIICPSRFVLESLPAAVRNAKPCHVVPYGAPETPPPPVRDPRDAGDVQRPLRLLFVGALSQRKGLADVFSALKSLGCPRDVELVLLGRPCAPWEFYRGQGVPFTYAEPRANDAVLDLMQTCDALVLPSLVEGRAIVQLEALSRGLPLLVTPNCGGEDLVTPGETGFMLPIRNPAALAEKISWLRENRRALPAMRAACRARAENITWAGYRRQLREALAGANRRVALRPEQV